MALGDISTIKAFISWIEKSETKSGSDMLRLRYSGADRIERGSVMFENKSTFFPELSAVAGKVCELDVQESTYNGKPSTKILKMTPLLGEDPKDYMRKSKIDVEAAMAEMQKLTADPDLGVVLGMILFDNPEMTKRFKTWPAAQKNHHAFEGGLIEHTYMMFKNASAIMDSDVAYAGVDRNVVLCALILHDVGKVVEYDYQPGLKIEVSMIGNLLGHISIVDSLVVRACTQKNIRAQAGRVLQLRHCILAHHGTKEWGSPVFPSTMEAVLVHQMDMVQSRGEMCREATDQCAEIGKSGSFKNDGAYIIKWK